MTESGAPSRQLFLGRVAFWATAAIVVVAALFRQAGIPKWSTLWAEDGQVFLTCAYRDSIACLVSPYQGYLHAAPRLGAAVAAIAPPVDASIVITLFAAVVAALAAGLAARAIAGLTGSWLAAVAGAAGMGLVWQAGREVLGNMANLHWVLFAATLVVLVCSWTGGRIGRADLMLIALTGVTSALSPILALAAIPAVIQRSARARLALGIAGIAAALQVVGEVLSERVASGAVPVEPIRIVRRFARDVLRDGAYGPDVHLLHWVVPAALAVVVAGYVLAVALRRGSHRTSVVRDLLPVVTLPSIGAGIYVISAVLNRTLNDRYAYLPAALMIAALGLAAPRVAVALGADRTGARQMRAARAVVPGVALLLAVGFASSFLLTARASNGPDVPAELRAADDMCTPGVQSIAIDISPKPASTHWILTVPCDRLRDPP